MVKCFICGEDIQEDQSALVMNGIVNEVKMHETCINGLKEIILGGAIQLNAENGILEKINDDWIVVQREAGVRNIILSYLSVQSNAIEVSPLYEWLRKNELKIGNPSDYIAKMKADDLIAVIQMDVQGQRKRMVKITAKGRTQLQEFDKH